MKTKEELIKYLESEIESCFKRSQNWTNKMVEAKGFGLEYVMASQMQNWYNGQEVALRKLLKELTK